MISKEEAGQAVRLAKFRCGVSWAALAEAVGRDPVWTVAALLGEHPMSAAEAAPSTSRSTSAAVPIRPATAS
jgi:cyanate lyase